MLKVKQYTIKYRNMYISKAHKDTEWCMVLNRSKAHIFSKQDAIDFVNDNMGLNIANVELEVYYE